MFGQIILSAVAFFGVGQARVLHLPQMPHYRFYRDLQDIGIDAKQGRLMAYGKRNNLRWLTNIIKRELHEKPDRDHNEADFDDKYAYIALLGDITQDHEMGLRVFIEWHDHPQQPSRNSALRR